MKDTLADTDDQTRRDVDLLRGLAATHLLHGGLTEARDLLDLARLIDADDHATLVLAARVQVQLGNLGQAVLLMAEAAHLPHHLSEADLAFSRGLRDRIQLMQPPVSKGLT
jgi:hypothetical protein